jgi:predicted transposase YbfD/YdcC
MDTIVGLTGGDFMIQVKENASDLQRRTDRILNRPGACLYTARTVDGGHGRVEERSIELAGTSPVETGWPHVHSVCRVARRRQQLRRGQVVSDSSDVSHYVCSFNVNTHTAERVLRFSRGHWTIENALHHVKDRSMNEDRNRASERGCGRVMCLIRSVVAAITQRAAESISVVRCRLLTKSHLAVKLLFCRSISEWERTARPYKLKKASPLYA